MVCRGHVWARKPEVCAPTHGLGANRLNKEGWRLVEGQLMACTKTGLAFEAR